MVRIGTVWDSTMEVVQGRLGMLAPVALLTLFLPSVVQAAIAAYLPAREGDIVRALLTLVVSLALMLVTIWGGLAITAMASRPDTTRAEAGAQATSRLPAMLGVALVLGAIVVILFLPVAILFAASGVDMAQVGQPGYVPPISGGGAMFMGLWSLAAGILLIWAFARLVPIAPVVLHEKLGLGAIRRSFAVTSGMTWKLIGVLILFGIVVYVAAGAAQLVVGALVGLLLGPSGAATTQFVSAVAAALVTTGFSTLAYVFAARLYALRSGRDGAAEKASIFA
jgi:hypothetical protein